MAKRRLPELPDTGRRYLDDTLRARLQSPGIERYPAARRRGRGLLALVVVAAAAAAAWWLATVR